MERQYRVITTMNKSGYDKYGRNMIKTWHQYWPHYIQLDVYAEDFEPDSGQGNLQNVKFIDLHEASPSLVMFKERHKDRPDQQNPKELALGAVRFAHKSYAVIHACMAQTDKVVIWLDADTVTHDVVTSEWLDSLLPEGNYTSFLGRQNNYTECGFVIYDTNHEQNDHFMMMWKALYDSDKLFELPQWHDCMAYDAVRATLEQKGLIETHNLSPEGKDYDHVFVTSVLGEKMDHLKGPRKDKGFSPEHPNKKTSSRIRTELFNGA